MPGLDAERHALVSKRQRNAIKGLFFIFLLGLAAFFFLQSSFFEIQNIKVLGNKHLKEDEVITLSGLAVGANIFRTDLRPAREKVALHPFVKEVEMTRDLPSTVVIEVTERKPLAMAWGQDGFAVISEDGHILALADNLGPVNYPIITGADLGSAGPGQEVRDPRMEAALKFLLAMPPHVRAAVSEINVSDLHNIRMFTVDKAEIRFGAEDRIEEKIHLYQEVISQKYDGTIQYIDISYKGNPVIRFLEAPEKTKDVKETSKKTEDELISP